MGGWKLEVGKMAIYMAFPVALFYIFNQPQYFEKWVIDKRREIFPPEQKSRNEELQNFVKAMNAKKELEFSKEMNNDG